jgi:hypothetical protein
MTFKIRLHCYLYTSLFLSFPNGFNLLTLQTYLERLVIIIVFLLLKRSVTIKGDCYTLCQLIMIRLVLIKLKFGLCIRNKIL